MPTGARTKRCALLLAQLLAVALFAVSNRALLAPSTAIYDKAKESKRPKAPKNVVRAEPVRIPAAEKQTQGPGPSGDASAPPADTGLLGSFGSRPLPRQAHSQLTRPDYLKSYSAGTASIPLSPPA